MSSTQFILGLQVMAKIAGLDGHLDLVERSRNDTASFGYGATLWP